MARDDGQSAPSQPARVAPVPKFPRTLGAETQPLRRRWGLRRTNAYARPAECEEPGSLQIPGRNGIAGDEGKSRTTGHERDGPDRGRGRHTAGKARPKR